GFLLGLGRLLPAALWFPKKNLFTTGYPTLSTLIDGLTSLHLHDFAKIQGLNWWEYDIYIGVFSSIFLILTFIIAFRFGGFLFRSIILIVPGFFLLLSLGNAYTMFTKLPLPFVGTERIASRFIIIPFMLTLITAVSGIEEALRSWGKHTKTVMLL